MYRFLNYGSISYDYIHTDPHSKDRKIAGAYFNHFYHVTPEFKNAQKFSEYLADRFNEVRDV